MYAYDFSVVNGLDKSGKEREKGLLQKHERQDEKDAFVAVVVVEISSCWTKPKTINLLAKTTAQTIPVKPTAGAHDAHG